MHQPKVSRTASTSLVLSSRPLDQKLIRVALLTGLITGALLASTPSRAASANASSNSTVVAPIAVARAADLAFGRFAVTTGGTVTISTSGARTGTGVALMNGITATAARFDVTGDTGATYSISVSGTQLSSGSDTMSFAPVSDLTGLGAITGNVTTGTLTGGSQSIFVGGVLTVAAAQPAGTYTGSITATVEYN